MTSPDLSQPSETPGADRIGSIEAQAFAELMERYPADQMTDSAMAELFGDTLRTTLAWTSGRGWLRYRTDAGYWESVSDVTARDLLRREMDTYWRYVARQPDFRPEDLKKLMVLADKRKIDRVLSLMAGVLETRDGVFDRDPWLLCVGNGVVDLHPISPDDEPELLEWSPSYYMTRHTSVAYRPGYRSEDWEMALDALPDTSEVRWLQARFGQAATGKMVPDAKIVLCTGGGSNGKSTILQAVRTALGTYAVVVPESILTANPGTHPTELTTLMGARLALIEELPEGKYLPSKRLKDLAGTPRITARRLYKDFVEWDASHSLFVTSNYRPLVSETDDGTWRRLVQMSFPMKFVSPTQPLIRANELHGDRGLPDRLLHGKEQLEAVLGWIVEGAAHGADRTEDVPDRIRNETREWRNDADLLRAFVMERCELDPDGMVTKGELYEQYRWWVTDKGHVPPSETSFSSRLNEHPELGDMVSEGRTRSAKGISRASSPASPLDGSQHRVWKGLKFRHTSVDVPSF